MKFKNYKELFEQAGDAELVLPTWGRGSLEITIEELYQHFKSRFIDDLSKEFNKRERGFERGVREFEKKFKNNLEEVENAARK